MENDFIFMPTPDARSYEATVELNETEDSIPFGLAVNGKWTVNLFIEDGVLTVQVYDQNLYPSMDVEPLDTLRVPNPKTKKD